MNERVFDSEDEVFEELGRHPAGSWTGEEYDGKWIARPLTFEERRENTCPVVSRDNSPRFGKDAIEIVISTTADLAEDEGTMGDEDWIALGKLVAAIARDERERCR